MANGNKTFESWRQLVQATALLPSFVAQAAALPAGLSKNISMLGALPPFSTSSLLPTSHLHLSPVHDTGLLLVSDYCSLKVSDIWPCCLKSKHWKPNRDTQCFAFVEHGTALQHLLQESGFSPCTSSAISTDRGAPLSSGRSNQ